MKNFNCQFFLYLSYFRHLICYVPLSGIRPDWSLGNWGHLLRFRSVLFGNSFKVYIKRYGKCSFLLWMALFCFWCGDKHKHPNVLKKEVVKYGDKDNFNMVKKHWEKSCNCPESVLLTD